MNIRSECVFCNGSLSPFYKRDNFPITVNPPSIIQPYEEDIYSNQDFTVCKECSCVQLGTLIDPAILYKDAHNNTYNTPTWKEHHQTFCSFILKTEQNELLEIGGNGFLYEMMKPLNPALHYTCLDMCEPSEKNPSIQYSIGNCETFNFPTHTNIVMSHVFEHLFNPRKFVERIHASQVESVYISIPHMERYVALCIPNLLHNEHTYYLDRTNVQWLFSQYDYELCDTYEFKNHSLFLKFIRKEGLEPLTLPNRPDIAEKINSQLRKNPFENVLLKPNSFIIPAGLYGQIGYYNSKSPILGYIDNDITKQGHRVYGTPYFVYSFDKLLSYSNITVYLVAGLYNPELKRQIESLNRQIEIIEL